MSIIKVLIIDDSKMMRDLFDKILSSDPGIQVIGTAEDPLIARELIKKTNPDVITLDIMLPHMDGITFLKNLMRLHPVPVIMLSTLTEERSAIGLEALAIGAVDYLPKPINNEFNDLTKFSKKLISSVKLASKTNIVKNLTTQTSPDKNIEKLVCQSALLKDELIAIGASTGGVVAIESILLQLPHILPPVVIVQHIKREFNSAFCKRISKLCGLSVVEAEDQTTILPGHIYIAPADHHLLITKLQGRYFTRLKKSPAINRHIPSIDLLFQSVSEAAGKNAIGILLTGMGSDGAEGLKAIRDAGGSTIVQDEKSSIVWGMPGSAVKLNAVEHIVSLNKIPKKILQILDNKMLGIKTT